MCTPRLSSVALAVGLALVLSPRVAQPQVSSEPCREDPRYGALLDWVGDWQVVDETGVQIASSRVRPILGGCALEEVRRRTDGTEEIGLIFFDHANGAWHQRWLSSLGNSGLFELAFEEDGVSVLGTIASADGAPTLIRGLIAPRPEGGFEQTLEIALEASDVFSAAGSTLYLPPEVVAATPTPPPAEPEPAPAAVVPVPAAELPPAASQPVPPTKVKVRSKRKAEAPIPETAMVSPMTLEFELGPLADLPPGAAWRTTELAPYVADQINIPMVTAQRRERRGKTELELVVNLRTRVGQSKVDLDVTLLSGEDTVATEREEGIALGKLIRAHDPADGLPQTVRLAIDDATFASVFADGKRPSVRLTVTVQ